MRSLRSAGSSPLCRPRAWPSPPAATTTSEGSFSSSAARRRRAPSTTGTATETTDARPPARPSQTISVERDRVQARPGTTSTVRQAGRRRDSWSSNDGKAPCTRSRSRARTARSETRGDRTRATKAHLKVDRQQGRHLRAGTARSATTRQRGDEVGKITVGKRRRLGRRTTRRGRRAADRLGRRCRSPAATTAATRPRPARPSRGTAARRRRPPPSSSSCVPCSAIRPWSSTTIRPAPRIVDRRWAITIAVRPGQQPAQAVLDPRLGVHVDVRGGLVEDQDARVGRRGARERHQLALAGRQVAAALADLGVVAVGQPLDELVRAHRPRPPPRPPRRSAPGAAEGDVVADRAREQEALLGHDPELRAQRALASRRAGRGRRPARRPSVGS